MSNQVLLVEDDVDLREADALAKVPYLKRLCLAVVDLLMPVMDGVEFIKRLRNEEHRDVPCVVMSGVSTPEVPEGTRLLHKPVRVPELLSCIETCCPA